MARVRVLKSTIGRIVKGRFVAGKAKNAFHPSPRSLPIKRKIKRALQKQFKAGRGMGGPRESEYLSRYAQRVSKRFVGPKGRLPNRKRKKATAKRKRR